jgi:F-type H+-transporting ATPase subunit gamma
LASARLIIKRRKGVSNIRKITRTMQLIATARFQAAFNRAVATKPYTKKISELVAQLSRVARDVKHPLLEVNDQSRRAILLVLTGNRGFCGGYNAGVLRLASAELHRIRESEITCDLEMSGKKGIGYMRFLKQPMAHTYTQFEDKPKYDEVEKIADRFITEYSTKKVDWVGVAYVRFVSTAVQVPTVAQLLPLQQEVIAAKSAPAAKQPKEAEVQYEFSPPPAELMAELLPATLKVRLFQCFTDAAVSEQVARMVAMKSATDAAGDMLKSLTRQYNRARQSQITLELLDIVGGAEALK